MYTYLPICIDILLKIDNITIGELTKNKGGKYAQC